MIGLATLKDALRVSRRSFAVIRLWLASFNLDSTPIGMAVSLGEI